MTAYNFNIEDEKKMNKRFVGTVSLLGFLGSIPFANWWLTQNGLWDAPILGPLPSALWVVAFSFVLRDLAQITIGKKWAWTGIAIGTFASWWIASPALAVASGVAFAVSESVDSLIFTPLADRNRFALAVLISGVVGGFLDSALFVRIAFGSWSGWWQLGIAKAIVVAAATPAAWVARRALLK